MEPREEEEFPASPPETDVTHGSPHSDSDSDSVDLHEKCQRCGKTFEKKHKGYKRFACRLIFPKLDGFYCVKCFHEVKANKKRPKRTTAVTKRLNTPKHPKCGFCRRGKNNSTCGKLHHTKCKGKTVYAHHKCLQYSGHLTQYLGRFQNFGGFDPKNVQSEIRRGYKGKCDVCQYKYPDEKSPLHGATAECALKSCPKAFHFPCARDHAVISRRKRMENGEKIDLYRTFCSQEHKEQFSRQHDDESSCSETEDEEEDYNTSEKDEEEETVLNVTGTAAEIEHDLQSTAKDEAVGRPCLESPTSSYTNADEDLRQRGEKGERALSEEMKQKNLPAGNRRAEKTEEAGQILGASFKETKTKNRLGRKRKAENLYNQIGHNIVTHINISGEHNRVIVIENKKRIFEQPDIPHDMPTIEMETAQEARDHPGRDSQSRVFETGDLKVLVKSKTNKPLQESKLRITRDVSPAAEKALLSETVHSKEKLSGLHTGSDKSSEMKLSSASSLVSPVPKTSITMTPNFLELPRDHGNSSHPPLVCPKWQDVYSISTFGRTVQMENSDVCLYVPPGAVAETENVDVNVAICANVERVSDFMAWNLRDDEYVVSPLAEYWAGGYEFQRPVRITLPHFMPADPDLKHVRVYCVEDSSEGGVVIKRVPQEPRPPAYKAEPEDSSSSDTCSTPETPEDGVTWDEGSSFGLSDDEHVYINSKHFSSYFCTYCGRKQERPEMYVMAQGSCEQRSRGCMAIVNAYIWDGKIKITDYRKEYGLDVKIGNQRNVKQIGLLDGLADSNIFTRILLIGPEMDFWEHCKDSSGSPAMQVEQMFGLNDLSWCSKRSCRRTHKPHPVTSQWALESKPGCCPGSSLDCVLHVCHVPPNTRPMWKSSEPREKMTHMLITVPVERTPNAVASGSIDLRPVSSQLQTISQAPTDMRRASAGHPRAFEQSFTESDMPLLNPREDPNVPSTSAGFGRSHRAAPEVTASAQPSTSRGARHTHINFLHLSHQRAGGHEHVAPATNQSGGRSSQENGDSDSSDSIPAVRCSVPWSESVLHPMNESTSSLQHSSSLMSSLNAAPSLNSFSTGQNLPRPTRADSTTSRKLVAGATSTTEGPSDAACHVLENMESAAAGSATTLLSSSTRQHISALAQLLQEIGAAMRTNFNRLEELIQQLRRDDDMRGGPEQMQTETQTQMQELGLPDTVPYDDDMESIGSCVLIENPSSYSQFQASQ